MGYAACTPLAVWLFLRFFYGTGTTFTAYEYLERRYDVRARTLGGLIFLVARALYGATVFFAAAQVFHRLTGWPPSTVIIAIGVFAVAYTTIGGMRAVMITDAIQTVVILAGLLAVLWKALALVGYDLAGLWQFAAQHDHTFGRMGSAEFYSFDPYVRFTFWIWILMAVIEPLQHYGTDQLVVQRLLASKDYASARRAIYVKTAFTPVYMALFFGVGLALFYYYGTVGDLPEGTPPDQVMAHFIITQLPAPLPGLIAAALLAALMSTVDSTVGSLSTVTCIDFLERFGILTGNESRRIRWGKAFTLIWGVVIIGAALALTASARPDRKPMVFELIAVWSALWSVLVVVMVAGVVSRRTTALAATLGLAVGMVINVTLPWYLYLFTPPDERISPFLVPIPGMLATIVVVVIVSLLDNCFFSRNTDDGKRTTLGGPGGRQT